MKTLIKIFALLVLFAKLSFPQFYADSSISEEIIEFMKIVDEHSMQNDPSKGIIKLYSDEEIYHIAKLYYKCYDENPAGFQKYVNEKHKEWEKAPIEVTSGKIKMRPWLKVYALRDKIRYKYGIVFTEVIGTSAFIRCKYITSKFSDYYSVDRNTHHRAHNFIFLVEDVLKGSKYFSVGDSISILMLPNVESPSPDLTSGNSYLIPIRTNLGFHEGSFNIIFNYLQNAYDVWEMGKPPKTFPIEKEIIKNCEYFGIKDTSWADFKKYFKETYLIFE